MGDKFGLFSVKQTLTIWNFLSVIIIKLEPSHHLYWASLIYFTLRKAFPGKHVQTDKCHLSLQILKANQPFPQLQEEVVACQGSLILQSLGLAFSLLSDYTFSLKAE